MQKIIFVLCLGTAAFAQTGLISNFAGNGTSPNVFPYTPPLTGDGGPALNATVASPYAVTLDANGNLYIGDGNLVRRVDAVTGLITTIAGGGVGADGSPATTASLLGVCSLRLDAANHLYVSETCSREGSGGLGGSGGPPPVWPGARIRRIDAVTGIITTFAGTATPGFSGDGGPATSAQLSTPAGMAFDAAGNLFIADSENHRIRRVSAATGIITTVYGYGSAGFWGDGGPATNAALNAPMSVAFDPSGNLLIADSGNHRIRRVNIATGIITTVAGTGATGFNGDGIAGPSATLNYPLDISVSADGNITFVDSLNQRVRVIDGATGVIWTMAGNGGTVDAAFGTIPATSGGLNFPLGAAVSSNGLFIPERRGYRVRRVALPGGLINTAFTLSSPATIQNESPLTFALLTRGGVPASAATGPVSVFTTFNGTPGFLQATLTNGTVTLPPGSLQVGTYALQLNYTGNAAFASNFTQTFTVTVTPTPPSIVLTASPNPSVQGQIVTLTATLSPCCASGTMTFLNGGVELATVPMSNSAATLALSTLAPGTYSLTAQMPNGTQPVVSNVITQRVQATSSLLLAASPSPSNVGQTVTLTATITPATATGTVQFLDNGTVIGSGNITSGSASFTTNSLALGGHAITASYPGDINTVASSSNAVSHTVRAVSTVALASSMNPANQNQPVLFTATVTPAAATGSVQFLDNGVALNAVPLTSGVAVFSTSTLSAGTHAITAVYAGDATTSASTAAALSQTIKVSAAVTLASSVNPANPGQATSFTATVMPATATGTVQFLDNGTVIGTAALTGGAAMFSTSTLSAGTHSISAAYAGNAATAAATSVALAQVIRSAATVALVATPNPSIVGQAVSLTATITPTAATGTIQFRDGVTVIGTATAVSGTATFSVTTLAQGTRSLTAVYSGDGAYMGATSATLTQTVNLAIPGPTGTLSAVAAGSAQVNLSWVASPVSGVTYSVYRGTIAGFTPAVANRIAAGLTNTAYVATGLTAATTYFFRVTAVNAGGESAPSNQASATTSKNSKNRTIHEQ